MPSAMPMDIEAPARRKAPAVVGPKTTEATRPRNPVPQFLADEAKQTIREPFDAQTHLQFEAPRSIIKMKDIGLGGHGISPNAVTEPFSLFSQEAIQQMRAEIFSDEVLRDCQFESTFCKNMVRGMGAARAPFTYAAWKSPELIEKISQVAGIDLVPSIDYEIANINVSVNNQTVAVIENNKSCDDNLPSFAWHYDSFPFVCVVMLSDCTDMVGGETALRTASGDVLKVRGPACGTAVVMQGRYIEHQALKAMGGRERISMVTCFRPKSPHVRDETILTGVRGISHKSELYTQYTEYRLEILEERVRAAMKNERLREQAKKPYDNRAMKEWLLEQRDFIDSMIAEIEQDE